MSSGKKKATCLFIPVFSLPVLENVLCKRKIGSKLGAVLTEAGSGKVMKEDAETAPHGSKISNRWQFPQP